MTEKVEDSTNIYNQIREEMREKQQKCNKINKSRERYNSRLSYFVLPFLHCRDSDAKNDSLKPLM